MPLKISIYNMFIVSKLQICYCSKRQYNCRLTAGTNAAYLGGVFRFFLGDVEKICFIKKKVLSLRLL